MHNPKIPYDLIWCEVDQCHYMIPRPQDDRIYLGNHFKSTLHQVAVGSSITLAATSAMAFEIPKMPFEKIQIQKEIAENIERGNAAWLKYVKGILEQNE